MEVCATDDDGGTGCNELIIEVLNVDPVVDAGPDGTGIIGLPFELPATTFTDVGRRDTHTAVIDWGDGVVEAGTVVEDDGAGTVLASHVYANTGAYAIEVCVTDDDGGVDCDNLTVTVNPGPPVLGVTKVDTLEIDDGVANPGDLVAYRLEITNSGQSDATGVILNDVVPAVTSVVAGSVVTSLGTVVSEDPVTIDLGSLAVGATATLDLQVRLDASFPVGLTEIVNQATVTSAELDPVASDDPDTAESGDPTRTPAAGDPQLAASKDDALATDNDSDGVPSPGDVVRYTITLENTGNGAATGVVLNDLVPANTAIVAGSVSASAGTILTEDPVEVDLGEVAAGASVAVTFDVTIANPFPLGVDDIVNQGTVNSDQLPAVLTDDPDVGGDADPTVTMVAAAPLLLAEKVDALASDVDGDGTSSPGDEIGYTVTFKNLGNTAATGVQFVDLIPAHTTLVAGSVTTSAGTVDFEDPVEVSVGQLAVGDEVTIAFRVLVANPIPAGVTEIVNQGAVGADDLDDVLSDDPDVGGDADSTVTPITAAPVLTVEKTDTLFTDPGGDTSASPGDELLYRVEITNSGNTGATAVRLTDTVPANTTLVVGTVRTSQGTVVTEDPVEVDLGQIDAGNAATVTFRVTVDDPFPTEVTEVSNQATVESAELAPVPSDDPDTPAVADPTSTPVFITPEISVDDVTVTEGDTGTVDAVFTLTLSRASNRPVTVAYQTAAGTATADTDYQRVSGDVAFAAGETSQTVTVPVLSDLLDEPTETFTVELSGADGGTLADASGLGTILDNDPAPAISIAGATVTEGDPGDTVEAVFTVTLSAVSALDVTVDYQTVDGDAVAGSDYQTTAGALLIPAGGQTATVVVAIVADDIQEAEETFSVVLTAPVNAVLATAAALGTIVDDDVPELTVMKTDSLASDTNGDGEANPGDTVRYQIVLSNPGSGLLSGVELSDTIPAQTALVAGSVTTSQGTVTSTDPVAVSVGDLAPGASATVSFEVAILGPIPLGLEQIENQAVVSSAELGDVVSDDPDTAAAADPTVTPIVGNPELVASKGDTLEIDVDDDGQVSPGDQVRYTIRIDNIGDGAATGIVLRDLLDDNVSLVAGSVSTTLGVVLSEDPIDVEIGVLTGGAPAAGASATVTFDVEIVNPFPLGLDRIVNQGTVTSDQLPAVLTDDPEMGGDSDPTVTLVVAMPRLVAEKTDALALDADGDGVTSPGDTLAYTVTVGNLGNTAATGVELVDLIPEHTTLVLGSVTTSAGTVISENSVEVSVSQLNVGDEVTIGFQVAIANPIPVGVAEIVNQGAVGADGVDDVLTDDPDVGGDADPTATPITAAPRLTVEKTDVLFADSNSDALASPGDELLYRIEIENLGNTGATSVVLSDAVPANTILVAGTVQTSQGTITSSDPIAVNLGQINVGTPAVVTFRVTVADPFPSEVTEVSNQATVESAELDPVLSDDPDTPAAGDPTLTPIFITPEIQIDDVTVTEGDPGDTVEAVFTLTLSRAGNRPVAVSYQTTAGTATADTDYTPTSGTVVFAAGETSLVVAVPVVSDLLDEPDETFTVELSNAEGGTLVDASGLGTILDNDPPPAVSIAGVTVTEGATGEVVEAIFTVTLSAPSGFDVTVDYLSADSTAIDGLDYQAVAGSLIIPAGSQTATVAVPVLGDAIDEPDETFTVQLTGVVHGVLAVPVATGTILDDDDRAAPVGDRRHGHRGHGFGGGVHRVAVA